MKEANVVIRMDEEMKKKLQVLADKDQRTLSDFIRIHLKNLLDKK